MYVCMSGKAYLLYTCENVDNCEQPLEIQEYILGVPTALVTAS